MYFTLYNLDAMKPYHLLKKLFLLIIVVFFCSCSQDVQQKHIPITTTSSEAKDLYQEARQLQKQYDIVGAEEKLNKALNEDSTFALAYMMKGMISENFEQRRKNILKAMQYAPLASDGEQLWIK
ncbi:MAG: hypothetical protein HKP45_06800, partial [Winogradskyella sp.]|nr:hypothetical protein [Winogradskyella sp.]